MEPVRLAAVRYLNTIPLIAGLEHAQGVTLLPAAPSAIAGMVRRSEADLGLCSVVDALRGEGDLALVPAGMIGCDGPTLTVRLFSRMPLAEVRTLHADVESHTSVILARLVLGWMGASVRVTPLQAGAVPADAQAALLIGDKVVTGAPSDQEFPHQLDLGEAWKDRTGLPFVYATWMCTREFAQRHPSRLATAAALLERQRLHNATRLDSVVLPVARQRGWPDATALRYVRHLLRYAWSERAREGMLRFGAEAHGAGLLERSVPLWADDLSPAPTANAPG